jgi:endonuclease YncB( thermonuclease family)
MRGDDGGEIEVRLYGIDAPERHQPWSRRSREALYGLIRGRALTLERVETDRYGRAVAKVTREPDGLIVNAEMVRGGNAWVYRRYTRDPALLERLGLEDLMELEEAARQQRRGLWSMPPSEQMPPWEWRRQNRGRDN